MTDAGCPFCCRKSSCNSSCDTTVGSGRKVIGIFLLFRVQQLICCCLCEGTVQTCFKCGRRGKYTIAVPPLANFTPSPNTRRMAHPPLRSDLQLPASPNVLEYLGIQCVNLDDALPISNLNCEDRPRTEPINCNLE